MTNSVEGHVFVGQENRQHHPPRSVEMSPNHYYRPSDEVINEIFHAANSGNPFDEQQALGHIPDEDTRGIIRLAIEGSHEEDYSGYDDIGLSSPDPASNHDAF